ncbi:S53 family peptidase [Candidatus Curtissbacteria bacterium]|nr:S53 family peptidase [Candidatus Curtissbacteria bacterium]
MRQIATFISVIALALATSPVLAQPLNLPEQALNNIPVCPGPAGRDFTRCHARVVTDGHGQPQISSLPAGYGPAQFHGAYNLPQSASTNQTIAIVDAYDHPNIKSDLDKYDSTFGLPLFPNCSSTVTTNCFKKVDQRGGTSYPQVNSGWALEIALDVEIAHGICPNCKLLLVEADSSSYSNLMTAIDRAVALGANVVSNSYGSSEFPDETSLDNHFNVAGVAFTFSSGDNGYGPEYPAASKYVTAVGGTTLKINSNNTYNNESVWSGTGSGCSSFESKPAWQTDPNCANRTIADVSADANPNTGAAVYDSVRNQGRSGWFQVGGTSLASPIVAGVYALSGNTSGSANRSPYSSLGNSSNLHDVTSGSNGSCSGSYLCTAYPGYDGPTGLGTPNGTGAF